MTRKIKIQELEEPSITVRIIALNQAFVDLVHQYLPSIRKSRGLLRSKINLSTGDMFGEILSISNATGICTEGLFALKKYLLDTYNIQCRLAPHPTVPFISVLSVEWDCIQPFLTIFNAKASADARTSSHNVAAAGAATAPTTTLMAAQGGPFAPPSGAAATQAPHDPLDWADPASLAPALEAKRLETELRQALAQQRDENSTSDPTASDAPPGAPPAP